MMGDPNGHQDRLEQRDQDIDAIRTSLFEVIATQTQAINTLAVQVGLLASYLVGDSYARDGDDGEGPENRQFLRSVQDKADSARVSS